MSQVEGRAMHQVEKLRNNIISCLTRTNEKIIAMESVRHVSSMSEEEERGIRKGISFPEKE